MRRSFFVFASMATGLAFACGGLVDPNDHPRGRPDGNVTTGSDPVPTSSPPSPDASFPPPEVDAAPPPRMTNDPLFVDLGTVMPGVDITFQVPPNALGFNVALESTTGAVAPADALGIERLVSPTGEIVHQGFTPAGGDSPTSQSFDGLFVAAEVPQSQSASANPPAPGTWTVRFAGPPDAALHAEVRIQVGPAAGFAGGTLDLHVYIPPGLQVDGKSLDATTAANDASIATRIDAFFGELHDLVGLDRGDVTFQAASPALRRITSDALLEQGFGAAFGTPPNAPSMKLLLTNAIEIEGDSAWGIAPGIPGVANRDGTSMSNIILAIGDTPETLDGYAIVHEMGHFIGLNHTSEFAGGLYDPLTDTPQCTGISLDDPSTITRCPDRSNVMFPTIVGAQIDIVPSQVAVYRGSPVYKAYGDGTMRMMSLSTAKTKRATWTKSGRALAPAEAWLAASLCGTARHQRHGASEPFALARALGRTEALRVLARAEQDGDLPNILRKKAARARTLIAAMREGRP